MDHNNDPVRPFEAGVMAAMEVIGAVLQKLTGPQNEGLVGAITTRLAHPPSIYAENEQAIAMWSAALKRLEAGAQLTKAGDLAARARSAENQGPQEG